MKEHYVILSTINKKSEYRFNIKANSKDEILNMFEKHSSKWFKINEHSMVNLETVTGIFVDEGK